MKNRFAPFFSTLGMVVKNNKIWFSARETNGVFAMGLHGEYLEYVGSVPGELEDASYLYGKCVTHENRIFFAPKNAKEIAVYDIETQEFHKYPLDDRICNNQYHVIVSWKEEIIFLPSDNNGVIISLDTKSGEILYDDVWRDKFKLDNSEKNLFLDCCVKDNVLYAPIIASRGQIMKYNLETKEVECISIGDSKKIKAICCDDKNFYLTDWEGNELLIMDDKFIKVGMKKIAVYQKIKIQELVYKNGHVFMFTSDSIDSDLPDMIIEYNIKTEEVHTICCINSEDVRYNFAGFGRFFAVSAEGNDIIRAYNGGNGIIYEIKTDTLSVGTFNSALMKIEPIYEEKFIRNNGNILFNEKRMGCKELETFLHLSMKLENVCATKTENGEKIWNYIKSI